MGLQGWPKQQRKLWDEQCNYLQNKSWTGVTLDESTHFGQIIKKLDFALDWISSGGLLSSAENPVFNDDSQLWSHNSVTLEKDFNFQENSFLSGEKLPATINSSDETKETWKFNINSRSNPDLLCSKSILQGENQFRCMNIEVDDSEVSNWSTRLMLKSSIWKIQQSRQ